LGEGEPKGEVPPEVETAWMNGARIELALLRGSAGPPRGTSGWLNLVPFDAHHHLAFDSSRDYDRLVRRLSGKAWGLVLSGGGARGLAHLGVIRAMREGGIPIDMIGGTSMGAILAAQCAMGCDDRQMAEMTRRAYVGSSGPIDLTVPVVSLRTGRGTIARLKEMFGDLWIEDLPTGYFCVSCNLTRAEAQIHDRGPVWLWTRVSCSVPGLLPPVPYRGDVLVDGGLLDNLPVDAMRKRLAGSVAAADVSVAVDLTVDSGLEPESPWSATSQTLRQLTRRPRLPNIVNVLMRTAEISSVRDSKAAGNPADLYLHVPVDGISMTDFQAFDRIVALGYEYTVRRLEAWRRHQTSELF
jgi:predicted acylesterase/phospholipase RssA